MGGLFGDVSVEAVVTVGIVAAAAAYATVQFTSPSTVQPLLSDTQTAKSAKKKSKAKAKPQNEVKDALPVASGPPVEAIPGDFDAPKVAIAAAAAPFLLAVPAPKKKSKGKKQKANSDSQTLNSSEVVPCAVVANEPTPAASVSLPERMPLSQLAPPSESESDDASNNGATRSTTSEGSSRPVPAAGFSWGDYEDGHDVEDDDDGWGVVKRSKGARNTSTIIPATANKPATLSSQQLTKKQRQNAAKREAEKSAKAVADKERTAALAKHKKELEKSRMAELAASAGKAGKVSGGMKASVDSNGKLVWE